MDEKPNPTHRRRRPHPARGARQVTGATSGLAALVLTGAMVAAHSVSSATVAADPAPTTTTTTARATTTTTTASTSRYSAAAAAPSWSVTTRSHGS